MSMIATATPAQRTYFWLGPLIPTAGSLAGVVLGWGNPVFLRTFGPIAFLMLALVWYGAFSIPRRVTLENGTLSFDRPLGRLTIRTEDVRTIDARSMNRGRVRVVAPRRTVYVPQNIPGLLPLLARVVAEHPEIRVRGELPRDGAKSYF
jgi:hypothetical protein